MLIRILMTCVLALALIAPASGQTAWTYAAHGDTTFLSHLGTWTVEPADMAVSHRTLGGGDTLVLSYKFLGTQLSTSTLYVGFSLPPGVLPPRSVEVPFQWTNGTAHGIGTAFVHANTPTVYLSVNRGATVAFTAGLFEAGGQILIPLQ